MIGSRKNSRGKRCWIGPPCNECFHGTWCFWWLVDLLLLLALWLVRLTTFSISLALCTFQHRFHKHKLTHHTLDVFDLVKIGRSKVVVCFLMCWFCWVSLLLLPQIRRVIKSVNWKLMSGLLLPRRRSKEV